MTESRPDHEAIAQRAYAIYQARGGTDGLDEEDWLRAEAELAREGGGLSPHDEVIPHGRRPELVPAPNAPETPGGTFE